MKFICAGSILIPDADWPIPVSGTWTGATPIVEEDTLSAAVSRPAAVGVKVI